MQINPRDTIESTEKTSTNRQLEWWVVVLLVVILGVAACFRFTGINWDDGAHVHPDERFLTWVVSDLKPVQSLADYFNTAKSTLNPNNRGFGFFVYGDLPVILVRYVAEWVQQTGYDQVYLVGRALSATADLLVVLLVFLIAERIYHRKIALLATAFSALAVLQIQLSHYFTVDNFSNLFTFVAIYYATLVLVNPNPLPDLASLSDPEEEEVQPERNQWVSAEGVRALLRGVTPYALFGLALGLAVASKLNTAPMAFLLPVAIIARVTRLPKDEQPRQWLPALIYLGLAAVISLVVFRICQPYAFTGPGFFDIKLNSQWITSLRELQGQSTGNIDAPFALQWTRRPIWFAWQNLTVWGLGLPLGLLAWAGVIWMGWRIVKGDWRQHLLLWGWTVVYFAWFTLQLAPTMRYLVLIYPTLAIIASWAVFTLWEAGQKTGFRSRVLKLFKAAARPAAWVLGVGILLVTLAWAYGFTRIYTRPETRVAASQWIYGNIPSAINLEIGTTADATSQPVSTQFGATITADNPLIYAFKTNVEGIIKGVDLADLEAITPDANSLIIQIASSADFGQVLASGILTGDLFNSNSPGGRQFTVPFDRVGLLTPQSIYYLKVEPGTATAQFSLSGQVLLALDTQGGTSYQPLPYPAYAIRKGQEFSTQFRAEGDGILQQINFPHIVDQLASAGNKTLTVTISSLADDRVLATGVITSEFGINQVSTTYLDQRGKGFEVTLDKPVAIKEGELYDLRIAETEGNGALILRGASPANETDWDLGLPLGLPGYPSAYDPHTGMFPDDLNLQVYWDDNPSASPDPLQDKLTRLSAFLDQSDYIFISSNRQWGSITRLPERYPLTTEYYRDLIGCPADKDILWCYRVAEPGMFTSKLGFELYKTFESYPNIGSVSLNDQGAEEAFTVYDHPKVLIFRKTADYNPTQIRDLLGAVDRTNIIHTLPKDKALPKTLMLPPQQLAVQQEGGTWSALFPPEGLFNRYPVSGLIVWYAVIMILGLLLYPILRLALPGLPDRGYPLARTAGMLLLAYLVWLAGSFGIPFSRLTISIALGVIALAGGYLFYRQREDLRREWRQNRAYFIAVEVIALVFFALDLGIRLGNPDLWHPYKGGEKPMDFSYFNAVLKSTTFPPYDPWFAGGYMNYYYYGFVIVGVLVKWLGIIPSIAYNLILPTLFSLLALGAFSIGWNLMGGHTGESLGEQPGPIRVWQRVVTIMRWRPFQIGLAAAVGLVLLGNLGTVRMIWQGFQKLAAPEGAINNVSILQHWIWAIQGIPRFLAGHALPYQPSDWYWIPSRAIPGEAVEPITEFPFFTFLYADLHAHLIDLPVTVFGLAWALSIVMGKGRWGEITGRFRALSFGLSIFFGALAVGATRATNTWDFPTYLAIGAIAMAYGVWSGYRSERYRWLPVIEPVRRMAVVGASVALFAGLAVLLYQPFAHWFGQAYNAVDLWKDQKTPFWSYLTHWGVFLFVITTWMFWETRDWMASTPLSSLRKLRPYLTLIWLGVFGLLVAIFALLFMQVSIAWLVLPLAAWAGILLLRPGQSDGKRFILFLTGTALILTLMVEVIVLRGDIGRMNTVFKFYLQAWTMLAISAAGALGWLVAALPEWRPSWRSIFETGVVLLVTGAALFPIMGGSEKIRDRMAPNAPHTLDGMTNMLYSQYGEGLTQDTYRVMDLSQDYYAIQWMQKHASGSPVIVEGHTTEYRWGTRFTIYTGLPGVVGWSWHERQQRAILPTELVTDRITQVEDFYRTTDPEAARQFLAKYNVRYIVVGQLEEIYYPGAGLDKFSSLNGKLWTLAYHQGDTSIYEVLPATPVATSHRQP